MKAPLTMDDNCYNMPRGTFELLASAVNNLCEFPEVELAEVANRAGYAPGCQITVWSVKSEHKIEVDGLTGLVTLVMTPLDGTAVETSFSGKSSDGKAWVQIQCLVLTSEGYSDAAEVLRLYGFDV